MTSQDSICDNYDGLYYTGMQWKRGVTDYLIGKQLLLLNFAEHINVKGKTHYLPFSTHRCRSGKTPLSEVRMTIYSEGKKTDSALRGVHVKFNDSNVNSLTL